VLVGVAVGVSVGVNDGVDVGEEVGVGLDISVGAGSSIEVADGNIRLISGSKNSTPATTKKIPKPHVFLPVATVSFSTLRMFNPVTTKKKPAISKNTPT